MRTLFRITLSMVLLSACGGAPPSSPPDDTVDAGYEDTDAGEVDAGDAGAADAGDAGDAGFDAGPGRPKIRIGTPSTAVTGHGPVRWEVELLAGPALEASELTIVPNVTGTAHASWSLSDAPLTVVASDADGDGTLAFDLTGPAFAAGSVTTGSAQVRNTPPTLDISAPSKAIAAINGEIAWDVSTVADAEVDPAKLILQFDPIVNGTRRVETTSTGLRLIASNAWKGIVKPVALPGAARIRRGDDGDLESVQVEGTPAVIDETRPLVTIGPPSRTSAIEGDVSWDVSVTAPDLGATHVEKLVLRTYGATATLSVVTTATGWRATAQDVWGNGSVTLVAESGFAEDLAGNESYEQTSQVQIRPDTRAPALAVDGPRALRPLPSTPFTVYGGCESPWPVRATWADGLSGPATAACTNNRFAFTVDATGPLTQRRSFTLKQTDRAGNEAVVVHRGGRLFRGIHFGGGDALTVESFPDGSRVVGGHFDRTNVQPMIGVGRFLANGAADPSFDPGTGPNCFAYDDCVVTRVWGMSQDATGRVYVYGDFGTFGGHSTRALARLNADGGVDSSFVSPDPPASSYGNSAGFAGLDPSGRPIVVHASGSGSSYRLALLRLREDGSADPTFTPDPLKNSYSAAAISSTGRIAFGVSAYDSATGRYFPAIEVRDASGRVDPSFAAASTVLCSYSSCRLAWTPDGKLLVSEAYRAMLRLLPTGAVDPTFTGPTLNGATPIIVEPGGGFLAGDKATSGNGLVRRYAADGSEDTAFAAAQGSGFGGTSVALSGSARVTALERLPSGAIVVGGDFQTADGHPSARLAKLLPTGAVDRTFTAPALGGHLAVPTQSFGFVASRPLEALTVLADGRIVTTGDFTWAGGTVTGPLVKLGPDDAIDTTWHPPALPANTFPTRLRRDASGRLLVGLGDDYRCSGTACPRLIRLLADGTRDPAFPTFNGGPERVLQVRIEPGTGRILAIVGTTSYGGTLARLSADGVPEATPLIRGTGGETVTSMDLWDLGADSSGRLLVAGSVRFSGPLSGKQVENVGSSTQSSTKGVLRFDAIGAVEKAYMPDFNRGAVNGYALYTLDVEASGRAIVGGTFYVGQDLRSAARVDANGTVDGAFRQGFGAFPDPVRAIGRDAQGRVVLAGYPRNGWGARRVDATGSPTPAFSEPVMRPGDASLDWGRDVAVEANGRFHVVGPFRTCGGEAALGMVTFEAE